MKQELRTDHTYNMHLINTTHCDKTGYPILAATNAIPDNLTGFNYVLTNHKNHKTVPPGEAVHFFLDDYQFERIWQKPEAYINMLKKYDYVLTPDFSLYSDMPAPMQAWNTYRSRAIGAYWQHEGLNVIPTASWSTPESYTYCFNGLPEHSTIAISTIGCINNLHAQTIWHDGANALIKAKHPTTLIIYGNYLEHNYPNNTSVIYYANHNTQRFNNLKEE